MGWIIGQRLYEKWRCSQELEEEYSEDTYSDGKQSALSNGNPTQLVYLSPDKMTAFSRLSRFGMMCKPLTADRGEDLLMWFQEDFLAKTYPVQAREQVLKERDQVCGNTWQELSVKYDLDLSTWRTVHCLLNEELRWSSVILPRWGMTVSGVLYQRQTAERPISATGSGLWATPTTMDKLPPKSEAALYREATVARPGRSKPANLRDQVSNMHNWPTPQASDNRDRGNLSTPAIKRRMEKGKQVMLSMCVSEENGRLNPTWVEWLMGWPLGWTDLKPLEMDRFQSWQQQHSIY